MKLMKSSKINKVNRIYKKIVLVKQFFVYSMIYRLRERRQNLLLFLNCLCLYKITVKPKSKLFDAVKSRFDRSSNLLEKCFAKNQNKVNLADI